MSNTYFSKDYFEARERFRVSAQKVGAQLQALPVTVTDSPGLTIDVAIFGPETAVAAVVVSSGCHGVEGFLGSAIQLAWLEQFSTTKPQLDKRIVMIHAINPYGFAMLRRFNEDNVDLNRNFLTSDEQYLGFPSGYDTLDRFLNPQSPPNPWELFRLKAVWNILRRGLPALKAAVAGGQYEFPEGLFFGGKGPCQSTLLIRNGFKEWIGPAQRIIHIDFHTGLGKFASFKLLIEAEEGSENAAWFQHVFGKDQVQAFSKKDGVAYAAKGMLGNGLQSHLADRAYHFTTAEFGTYDVIRVLGAIRRENRAHWYSTPDSDRFRQAKAELLECFTPESSTWRDSVVSSGLDIISRSQQYV